MKKLISLACLLALTVFTKSFSQSTLYVENGTANSIDVILYSYDLSSCTQNGVLNFTIASGATIPVNSNPGSEWIIAEFNSPGCGSQLAVEANGLGACLPCPSFGIPNGVMYNLCATVPFKAYWDSYCEIPNTSNLQFYQ